MQTENQLFSVCAYLVHHEVEYNNGKTLVISDEGQCQRAWATPQKQTAAVPQYTKNVLNQNTILPQCHRHYTTCERT